MCRLLSIVAAAFVIQGITASPARADFVPGRLYISAVPRELAGGPYSRILEFDPLTGSTSEFFSAAPVSWLTFVPNRPLLRASSSGSRIIEIDGDAGFQVALDGEDGIVVPRQLAYDDAGDFYSVHEPAGARIIRFPAGSGPGEDYADLPNIGPIAGHPGGGLYYGDNLDREIFLLTAPGKGALFDTLPSGGGIRSLTTDSAGNLFALTTSAVYRYTNGDADSRQLLASFPGPPWGSIAMSPDESRIYVVNFLQILSIDVQTGDRLTLGSLPDISGLVQGRGMAVYVPEQSAIILLFLSIPFLFRR